jgi:hypothetical protein
MERAFAKTDALFVLPMYFPLAYSKKPDVDTKVENRQRQVVGLIRTVFLKRFESSIASFAGSCADLATKIAQWIADNSSELPDHSERVEAWTSRNHDLLEEVHKLFRPGVSVTEIAFADDEEDGVLDEIGVSGDELNPEDFDLEAMFAAAFEDLVQLTSFLERTVTVGQMNDDKYGQLRDLLVGGVTSKGKKRDSVVFDPAFTQQKVLVFTEYADTARYLYGRLVADGLTEIDYLDGSRKGNRLAMIRRFAPHYNRVSDEERAKLRPLRVLISTDVLSEGVNLQDASLVVNYDIHWNPVRLMQRIGRVDRRLDADRETAIVAENPKTKKTRGKIQVRNFLPPDELNRILSLYSRVQSRVLLISKTLGIPGGRLLTADDMLDDVKVFNSFLEEYQGDVSPLEALRLRYLDLASKNPGLEDLLEEMPKGVYASRKGQEFGLFTCTVEPIRIALEEGSDPVWTLVDGRISWAFRRTDGTVTNDLAEIDLLIACDKSIPGVPVSDRLEIRNQLRRWQDNRYEQLMKTVGLSLDAPKPITVCWMEIQ